MSDQSPQEAYQQASNDVEALTHTLNDQFERGRIKQTFKATLNDEGVIVPSGYAPTAKHDTIRIMAIRRLITLDKQDDGSFDITLNPDAMKKAIEDKRAKDEKAQAVQAAHQKRIEDNAARAERMRELNDQERERRDYAQWRASIRSKI